MYFNASPFEEDTEVHCVSGRFSILATIDDTGTVVAYNLLVGGSVVLSIGAEEYRRLSLMNAKLAHQSLIIEIEADNK